MHDFNRFDFENNSSINVNKSINRYSCRVTFIRLCINLLQMHQLLLLYYVHAYITVYIYIYMCTYTIYPLHGI